MGRLAGKQKLWGRCRKGGRPHLHHVNPMASRRASQTNYNFLLWEAHDNETENAPYPYTGLLEDRPFHTATPK